MGRYWSVEECGWVAAGDAADPDLQVRAEQEPEAVVPVLPDQRQVQAAVGHQQG